MSVSAIQRLLHREDFRRRPLRALSRRVIWRLRWLSTSRPWHLHLDNGLSMFAPHCGAGALIYYQGCSEPETTRFLQRFLKPGMIFFDIGAHIGEYALVASLRVGSAGAVHAFEAQPDTVEILRRNVASNGLKNVIITHCAVAASDGTADFAVRREPSLSSMACEGGQDGNGVLQVITVPKRHLDAYCWSTGAWPHLIKIDVEGAELEVLRGAKSLLEKPKTEAPVWIFEYSPETYRRFQRSLADVIELFDRHGYRVYRLKQDGGMGSIQNGHWDRSQNLIARK